MPCGMQHTHCVCLLFTWHVECMHNPCMLPIGLDCTPQSTAPCYSLQPGKRTHQATMHACTLRHLDPVTGLPVSMRGGRRCPLSHGGKGPATTAWHSSRAVQCWACAGPQQGASTPAHEQTHPLHLRPLGAPLAGCPPPCLVAAWAWPPGSGRVQTARHWSWGPAAWPCSCRQGHRRRTAAVGRRGRRKTWDLPCLLCACVSDAGKRWLKAIRGTINKRRKMDRFLASFRPRTL